MKQVVKQKTEAKPVPVKKASPVNNAASSFFRPKHIRSSGHSLDADAAEKEADTIAEIIVKDHSFFDTPISIGRSTIDTIVEKQNASPILRRALSRSGTPLDLSLKQWMASRLGKNFNKIRIHDDLIAHEAARSLHARAFTYGDNIYFGAGQYQPGNNEGKELIAHELVHTIQQGKGRKGIQRKPTIFYISDFRKEVVQSISFETIFKLHRDANKDNKVLQKKLDELEALDLPALWVEIEKLAEATLPGQERQLDFIFDIYKYKFTTGSSTDYKDAIELAKKKNYLPKKTAFYDPAFYTQVLMGDLSWLPNHPDIKKSFYSDFIDSFHMMLMGTSGKTITIYSKSKLTAELNKIQAVATDHTDLLDTEQRVVSLKTILTLDEEKDKMLGQALTELKLKRTTTEAIERLKENLSQLDWVPGAVSSSLVEETAYLWKVAGPIIKQNATKALDFTKHVDEGIVQLSKSSFYFRAYVESFKRHKKFFNGKFESFISKAAKDFLKLTSKGEMPDARQFDAQKKRARKPIDESMSILSLEIIRLTRHPDPKATAIQKELPVLCGIFYRFLDGLNGWMSAGTEFEIDLIDFDNKGNRMMYHRFKFGEILSTIGIFLDSDELNKIANEVQYPGRNPKLFGGAQIKSFFALGPEASWQPEELPVRQSLKKFMEENTAYNDSDRMAAALAYFMKNQLYLKEIDLLKDLLAKIDMSIIRDTPDNYTPIPNQVYKKLEFMSASGKLQIPIRYISKDIYFSPAPGKEDAFSKEIWANKPVVDFTKKWFGEKSLRVIPNNLQTHFDAKGIVQWVLLEDGLKEFDRQMSELAGTHIKIDLESDPLGWFLEFEKIVKAAEAPPASGAGAPLVDINTIDNYLKDGLQATMDTLKDLRRKAFSYHRRVLLKHKLQPLWDEYKEHGTGNIEVWGNATKAVTMLVDMAGPPVLLGEDNQYELKLQISAGLLELSETIYKRLFDQGDILGGGITSSIGMIARLLPHIYGALSLQKDVAKYREQLMVEYLPGKHADKVDALTKMAPRLVEVLKKEYEHEEIKIFNTTNLQFLTSETVGDWMAGTPKTGSGEAQIKDNHSRVPFTSKPEDIIHFDGDAYQLVSVEKDFLYRPSVELDSGGVTWDKDMIENINPSSLMWKNADGSKMEPVALKDRPGKKLFRIRITWWKSKTSTEFDVTADNREMLKKIRAIIAIRSNMKDLELLGKFLNTAGEWLKLPLYFIPGVGQAVMAADLVVGVIQFFGSDEFKVMKDIVMDGDGKKLITSSIDKVGHLFTKEGLWNAMFDDQFEMPAFDEQPKTHESHSVVKRSDGKIMKLLRSLIKFGKKLWNGVSWLKNKINHGLKRIHMFILNRPMLAAVIGFITQNYYFIEAAAGKSIKILGNILDSDSDDKKEIEEPDQFSGEIGAMVGQVGEIQVPMNLVPIEILMDIIVRMALKLIRGPAGVVSGAVKDILDKAGIYDKILGIVSEQLAGTDLDPNKYINDFIADRVKKPMEEASAYFLDNLFNVFSNVEDLKKVVKPAGPTEINTVDSGDSIDDEDDIDLGAKPLAVQPITPPGATIDTGTQRSPMAQPFPGKYFRMPLQFSLPSHPIGGNKMDKEQKEEMEEKYGQDFSHVRIHTGADADQVTSESGAEALTTGSHIYLKKDLSPQDVSGKSVLQHELAHVIQQTGSRPAGEEHSVEPVDGSPGQGLVFDPGMEAEAENFAATNDQGAAGSMVTSDGNKAGLQPSWADVSLKFFETVSAGPELNPTRKALKSVLDAPSTVREKILAGKMPGALLNRLKKLTYHPRLQEGSQTKNNAIASYLAAHLAMNDDDAKLIVRLSKIKKKIGGKDADELNWILDEQRLNDQLMEFVLLKTGVMTKIKTVITGDTIVVEYMEATDIHIDHLHVDATIWKPILDNTFLPAARGKRFESAYTGDSAQVVKYMNAGKRVIGEFGLKRLFASVGFKLVDGVARRIELEASESILGLRTGKNENGDPKDVNSAIPINWYKAPGAYPKTIVLPKVRKTPYAMNSTEKISHKGEKIQVGVDKSRMVEKGKKLIRKKDSDDRTNSDFYRDALKDKGYDLTKMDIDHVTDLAFDGPDAFGNLWPLDRRINRIAYDEKWYSEYKIEYLDNSSNNVKKRAPLIAKNAFEKRFFVIKGFSEFPERPGGRWDVTV